MPAHRKPQKSPKKTTPAAAGKKRMGRPPFLPSIEQRGDVCMLKAAGWEHYRIARRFGISVDSLERHFRHELDHGADMEKHKALKLLKEAAEAGNISALKEWHKLIGAGSAIEEFLDQPEAPPREPAPPKRGKKEIAHDEALRAHEDSEWGDDLKPIGQRTIN